MKRGTEMSKALVKKINRYLEDVASNKIRTRTEASKCENMLFDLLTIEVNEKLGLDIETNPLQMWGNFHSQNDILMISELNQQRYILHLTNINYLEDLNLITELYKDVFTLGYLTKDYSVLWS